MRRLMLLRHAKSDWTAPGTRDHDRPLNPRGREAAPKMGAYMARHALVPDLIVASTATRVTETLDLRAARLRKPPKVVTDRRIYEAERERAARRHQGDAARGAQPAAGRPQSRARRARLPADRLRRRRGAPAADREIPDRRARGDRLRDRRLDQAPPARRPARPFRGSARAGDRDRLDAGAMSPAPLCDSPCRPSPTSRKKSA